MAMFEQTVAVPSTRDYAPPTPDIFAQVAGLSGAYYQGQFNKQQRELNDQAIRQGQIRQDIQQTFRGGLPTNADGTIDYGRAVSMLAQKGDPNAIFSGADAMFQQRAAQGSTLLNGGAAAQPAASPDVATTAGKIIQVESGGAPSATNPKSSATGLGQFTDATWLDTIKKHFPNLAQGRSDDQLLAMRKIPQLAQRMTEAFTADNQAGLAKAGLPVTPATSYLAHFLGLGGATKVLQADPNTPVSKLLTADAIKANPFLKDMTARDIEAWAGRKMAGPTMVAQNAQGSPAQPQPAQPSGRVQVADASSALPPSASAGTPAASYAPTQPAPNGAPLPAPAAQTQAAQPQQPQQPQQPAAQPQAPGQALVPQVPLPKGFTDPQAAILALRAEAARYSAVPHGQGTAQQLTNWAERIENSLQPVKMGQYDTYVDPRNASRVVAEGPGAAMIRATESAGNSSTLDADAERYRQTGQLPPNMGRGMQGAAEARAIRQRATQIEQDAGGDPAAWPEKWQQFKIRGDSIKAFNNKNGNTVRSFNVLVDHLDTLTEAANALKNGDARIFNRFRQTWAANTGDPAPTNFDGVKALVGDEIVKAVVGSAGALADREEVKKDLDRASSPQQLAGLVEKYKKLALGQLHGLEKQYEFQTKQKDFRDALLPGTLKALGGGDAEKETAPAAGKVSADGFHVYDTAKGKVRVQKIGDD